MKFKKKKKKNQKKSKIKKIRPPAPTPEKQSRTTKLLFLFGLTVCRLIILWYNSLASVNDTTSW